MSLRIFDQNWAFETATAIAASSADASFPASNLALTSRGKVWRSSGNFKFTANKYIDFKEASGGAVLSAVIPAGTYTPTTLAAQIVTSMQAAGTKTYTCSYSTATGKWTIATTNGTYLALLWQSGTNTANSIGPSIGYAVTDQTGALTYTGANIAIHTEEWVVFDFQTAVNVDSFAQLFHPTRGNKFTLSAQLRLQANATNVWTAPAVDIALTINETFVAIANFWSSVQSYRYWRLKIVDPTNTELFIEVAKCSFAKATVLARGVSNTFSVIDNDRTKISETDYGHRYGDVYPVAKTLKLNFPVMSYADLTTLRSIYKAVGQFYPIVISFTAFTGKPNQFTNEDLLVYGCFPKSIEAKHKLSGNFDDGFDFQEVF